MKGLPATLLRLTTLATLLLLCGLERPAQADFLDVWLEAPAKGRLVVIQQIPDFSRGFDTFQVVELDTKKSKVVKSTALAESERKNCMATGQYEVYLAARDRARKKLEKSYVTSGYAVPAGTWSNDPPGRRTLVLESGENRLVLSLSMSKDGPVLELSLPGKAAVPLQATELLTTPSGSERPASSGISFRHVLVARRGRMLVVILREMPVPSPEYFPRDRLFVAPLAEPLKGLGIEGPLKNVVISLP